MSKDLVIKIRWGGLGDHLFHSHLPRLAKQSYGYDHVYISTFSNYNHPNTKRLVWDLNPFVDGFVDIDHPKANFAAVPEGQNILDAVSSFYGLIGNHTFLQEPEIYYTPKVLPELASSVVCEFNHINSLGIPSLSSVLSYFSSNNVCIDHQIAPFNSSQSAKSFSPVASKSSTPGTLCPHKPAACLHLASISELRPNNLEELCDIIASCKKFFCVISGPATLAPSLQVSAQVLFVDGALNMFRHSQLNSYTNLTGY